MTAPVKLYTTRFCPYCVSAKRLLQNKHVDYLEISVDGDLNKRAEMTELSGRRTVPQIWIGDLHIGGFDELAALDRQGRLDSLLEQAQ
ncbi:glutaredoxin 3 [Kineobactrum sediminis]|uniref:Glutaredoxin n=1 Tax=Kineobactrum sediminis TaxID=1905677 RepID=A0A2N5Y7A9_9GAMM|nr:glutaredoxin 3 [Kineobactrum sediminis]PLW84280.1 glutaredoxin 3 [Kineobactrum sediminis]